MTRRMHENSLEAYHALNVGERCAAILKVYADSFMLPLTDREVMERLGLKDMNAVRPRITELIDAGYLQEVTRVKDQVTNRTVRCCVITDKVEKSAVCA